MSTAIDSKSIDISLFEKQEREHFDYLNNREKVSKEHYDSIIMYSGYDSDWTKLADFLRSPTLTRYSRLLKKYKTHENIFKTLYNINDVIMNAPRLDEDIIVYRGAGEFKYKFDHGVSVIENSIISTSFLSIIAEGFNAPGNKLQCFKLVAGTPMLNINSISKTKEETNEYEIILPAGSILEYSHEDDKYVYMNVSGVFRDIHSLSKYSIENIIQMEDSILTSTIKQAIQSKLSIIRTVPEKLDEKGDMLLSHLIKSLQRILHKDLIENPIVINKIQTDILPYVKQLLSETFKKLKESPHESKNKLFNTYMGLLDYVSMRLLRETEEMSGKRKKKQKKGDKNSKNIRTNKKPRKRKNKTNKKPRKRKNK